jgi:GAF domain-containing protein
VASDLPTSGPIEDTAPAPAVPSSSSAPLAPAADPVADLTATFGELTALLTATETFPGFLDDVCDLVKRSFAEEIACSVTVVAEGRNYTAASSDDIATVADEGQYGEQTGPCLRALAENTEIYVGDLTTETRFGDYPPKALALGIRSIAALPLSDGANAIGALNLYSTETATFQPATMGRPRALASACAGALEVARRVTTQLALNEDLKAAMASRRFIDQALGILMAQQNCDADAAFDLLRRSSQNSHRKLRDVAVDLVTEVGGVRPEVAPVFTTTRRP